ncbi:phosphoesterase [Prolixibacter bellariivorans]|uniref:Phosphoesterase n=1 Tax=Prolixibacter bellariivorans TaxID=314319 RepID=A0A5M4AVS4_9BACT|nr:metallophosphoesterase family protein [Prolixibacter bellariivorans]GET31743.1 phosphoesterase [Prolixibacter bellariivorans]
MKRIGLLSDTHGYMDNAILNYLSECDEIWHAGDIGNLEVVDQLAALKPLRAVYGNIDGDKIRQEYPLHQRFLCEEVDVWMTHIGGYPGRYERYVTPEIYHNPPKLFISGHSHILKVVNDQKLGLLHINPGAAGVQGFHQVRTLIRFSIDGSRIFDLEVVEMGRRGSFTE